MSESRGQLVACTLTPPTDGRRCSVALNAGQILVIACDEAVPVLLIREAGALDIDFGAGGTIRLVNGVAAAGLRPVPMIAGRDGGLFALDRLAALLDPGLASSPQSPSGGMAATAERLTMPYGRGVAMPALLDADGLHPGIPGIDGVTPEPQPPGDPESLPDGADSPDHTVLSSGGTAAPGREPTDREPTDREPTDREPGGVASALSPVTPPAPGTAPSPLPADNAAPHVIVPTQPGCGGEGSPTGDARSDDAPSLPSPGNAPELVYGDALLYPQSEQRGRRLTAIRRARRRGPELAGDEDP